VKANRQPRTRGPRLLIDDTKAEQGISMMIVYVSLVLVAAVAGAVLIQNGAKLREKSERTGTEVARQVSSNMNFISAQGQRAAPVGDLDTLNLLITPAAASAPIDLFKATVLIQKGDLSVGYNYTDQPAGSTRFNTTELRDVDDSHAAGSPNMNSGDLIYVNIDLAADGMEFAPRDVVTVTIFPEVGNALPIHLDTPAGFGDSLVITFG
jgi:archaellin